MNRKDYFLAIVAGVFTGFFVFFIFKHVDIEIPGGMISLLAGIPALWILVPGVLDCSIIGSAP